MCKGRETIMNYGSRCAIILFLTIHVMTRMMMVVHDATAILEESRRIASVLPRRARRGVRQVGNRRARDGTDGVCSWQRSTACWRMERTTDACAKCWWSRAALYPDRPNTRDRTSIRRTWYMQVGK